MSKTILITGASSGFGRLTAEKLARSGHTVFAGFRSFAGPKKQVADELKSQKIEVLELDVTRDKSVNVAVSHLLEKSNGELDVVINNAGIASAGVSETFTPEQARELFEVNVFGVQRVLRATLPTLRARRSGLAINVGSILGRVTLPFFGIYGASKQALEAISDSYRYELSQLGVDVVLVQPSAYPTNMYASAQQPADSERRTLRADRRGPRKDSEDVCGHLPEGERAESPGHCGRHRDRDRNACGYAFQPSGCRDSVRVRCRQ